MARALLALLLVVFVACTDEARPLRAGLTDSRESVDRLKRELDDARERADEFERDLREEPEIDRSRFVDMWGGGPTMAGPLLALPRLGVMRWYCDEDFGFRIVFEVSGASAHVAYDTQESTSARMLHPGQEMGATIGADESVTWTIKHRHSPGLIRARIEVRTARSKHGNCLVPALEVSETARLYD